MTQRNVDRRQFLGGALAAAATVSIVPASVLGKDGATAPSERLRVVGIGCGGKGYSDIHSVAREGAEIVALCDPDAKQGGKCFGEFPKAKKYADFRKMYDEMLDDIDAVIVSTPDHTHAVASMPALQAGKGCYTQKPLTRTIAEAHALAEAAKKSGSITQMGNQGHAGGGNPATREYLEAGAIGDLQEVFVWTNRPIWPQGMTKRPAGKPAPKHLDWDVWLGPAPQTDYSNAYLPFNWRGWIDYGAGALGDMGCHHFDTPVWALQLGAPKSVRVVEADPITPVAWPRWATIEYIFEYKGKDLKLTWMDGKKDGKNNKPPRPEGLEKDRNLPDNGVMFVGDEGAMFGGGWGAFCRPAPETRMKEIGKIQRVYPRSIGHYKEWVYACLGKEHNGKKVGMPDGSFDYAARLTETVLMGNLALAFPDATLQWDAKKHQVANLPEANKLLSYEYREGWKL